VSQIAGEPATQDFVEVRLPAAGAYLSVLRTATAGLAARLDFTLDEIEDLRIAVDEACAILLQQAVPGSVLSCVFRGRLGSLPAQYLASSNSSFLA
jgi:serine/threonine-protein kinase RsbW